jgi:hypothetical protein
MNKKIIGFKINYLKNIGEMSEQRSEMLVKEFANDFPGRNNNIPMGLLLSKSIDSTTVKTLFIAPTQVTYSIDGENAHEDFFESKNVVRRIFDKLYLGHKCNGVCNYTCIIEEKDILEQLKNKINIKLKDTNESQKIGFKVLIKNEDYVGNFILEPYAKDAKYLFCLLELEMIKALSVNDITKEAEKIFQNVLDDLINQTYYKLKTLGEA